MIKTLAKSIREYKLPSILTLIFIMGEVIIEVLIPSITPFEEFCQISQLYFGEPTSHCASHKSYFGKSSSL